ncbi:unnamed protein product [Dimorphilus gyrociliatus]|uniref:Uncharacterized protein n=1 Tax=Dimorphilus gyrociliatus TaxID=2664684 RepID=A0A7I8WFF1_9ANNE|nr:unnamed protein product [Dimorphilus gyrociliatus]
MLSNDKYCFWCFLFGSVFFISVDTQHVNIAFNQTVSVSTSNGNDGDLAVNGIFHIDSFFQTNISLSLRQWWMVTFDKQYFVRTIRILNSKDGSGMKDIDFLTHISTVNYLNSSQFSLCNTINEIIPKRKAATIDCLKGPQYSRSLVVEKRSTDHPLTICEIEIWTMRDIDRNKMDVSTNGWWLRNANDGQSDSGRFLKCPETASASPGWWKMNLEVMSELYAVSIVSRAGFNSRLNSINIIVNNDNTELPWIPERICSSIDKASSYMTRRCQKSTVGQFLALVRSTASNVIMSICEIEVFGSTIKDEPQVNWVINSYNSSFQHYNDNSSCSVNAVHSIGISQYQSKALVAELKGVSLLQSCLNAAFKIYVTSFTIEEECELINHVDGYYSELDMMDSCIFKCQCQSNNCLRIHFTILQSKLLTLNRDFYIIVNI